MKKLEELQREAVPNANAAPKNDPKNDPTALWAAPVIFFALPFSAHICLLFSALFSISYAAQQAYEKEQFDLPQPDAEFLAWKFKGASMTAPFYVRYYSFLTMSSIYTIIFVNVLCPFP